MIMLSTICAWHGIVTTISNKDGSADRIENIVLTALAVIYILYNIGFIFMIYLFVSIV